MFVLWVYSFSGLTACTMEYTLCFQRSCDWCRLMFGSDHQQRQWQSVVQACVSSWCTQSSLEPFKLLAPNHLVPHISWWYWWQSDNPWVINGLNDSLWSISYVVCMTWLNFNTIFFSPWPQFVVLWHDAQQQRRHLLRHHIITHSVGPCLIDHLGEEEVNQNHFSFSLPAEYSFQLQLLLSTTCISSVAEPLNLVVAFHSLWIYGAFNCAPTMTFEEHSNKSFWDWNLRLFWVGRLYNQRQPPDPRFLTKPFPLLTPPSGTPSQFQSITAPNSQHSNPCGTTVVSPCFNCALLSVNSFIAV